MNMIRKIDETHDDAVYSEITRLREAATEYLCFFGVGTDLDELQYEFNRLISVYYKFTYKNVD